MRTSLVARFRAAPAALAEAAASTSAASTSGEAAATAAKGEPVRSLMVTLTRSWFWRTPWFHQRIIKALGFKRRLETLEKPNTAEIRGMLEKIPHKVIVETDRMYYERRMREYRAACPRPPLVFYHAPRLPPAPAKLTEHKEMLIERHVDAAPEGGFDQLWVKKKPRPPPQGNLRRGRS